MNERIKAIVEQAMVKTADMSRPGRKELDPEKFTELILKECSSLMINLAYKQDQSGAWKNYPAEVIAMFLSQEMNKHFGVEK